MGDRALALDSIGSPGASGHYVNAAGDLDQFTHPADAAGVRGIPFFKVSSRSVGAADAGEVGLDIKKADREGECKGGDFANAAADEGGDNGLAATRLGRGPVEALMPTMPWPCRGGKEFRWTPR